MIDSPRSAPNPAAEYLLAQGLRLAEHIRWTAQTVHQAHHHGPDEWNVTWENCGRATCVEARKVLEG